jgi:N-acetylneuraminic acid mutarotase
MKLVAHFLTVLAVAACSSSSSPGISAAPDAGTLPDAGVDPVKDPTAWRATGSMTTARAAHSASLLADGTVLVIGGETAARDMIASAEIYDPVAEKWSTTESLPTARSNHVAVTLADGGILVAGGGRSAPIGQPSSAEVMGSALIFDPSTKHFTATGSLVTPRSHAKAVRLDNGEVLIAGGGAATTHQDCNGVPNCGPIADPLASVERFDPATGRFRAAASMKHARYSFTLTHLQNGRVVAAGGVSPDSTGTLASTRSAEIYDPATDTWTDAADMPAPDREHQSAIMLDSGGLLLVGGKEANIGMIKRVDLFSPDTNAWKAYAQLSSARTLPNLVRLQSGHVLAVGGYDQPHAVNVAESVIFDEKAAAWTTIGPLTHGRSSQTTTLLADGSVLVVGGLAEPTTLESATCERTKVD